MIHPCIWNECTSFKVTMLPMFTHTNIKLPISGQFSLFKVDLHPIPPMFLHSTTTPSKNQIFVLTTFFGGGNFLDYLLCENGIFSYPRLLGYLCFACQEVFGYPALYSPQCITRGPAASFWFLQSVPDDIRDKDGGTRPAVQQWDSELLQNTPVYCLLGMWVCFCG